MDGYFRSIFLPTSAYFCLEIRELTDNLRNKLNRPEIIGSLVNGYSMILNDESMVINQLMMVMIVISCQPLVVLNHSVHSDKPFVITIILVTN